LMTKLKLTWRLTLLCLLFLTCSCTTLVKREAGSNTKKWFAALGSDLRNERLTAVREARQYAKDVSHGVYRCAEFMACALEDEEWIVRERAAEAIGELGGAGIPAVDSLLNIVEKETNDIVRSKMVYAIGRIGREKDIPVLMRAMSDESYMVREKALYTLSWWDDKPEVQKLLVTALSDSDADVREVAAFVLGEKKAAYAIPGLVKCLSDRDNDVRMNAARSLGHIGPSKRETIDALKQLFDDENRPVRVAAVYAIGKSTSHDPYVTSILVDAMKQEDLEFSAMISFQRMGPKSKDAVPALCEMVVSTTNALVRNESLLSLAAVGGPVIAYRPSIDSLLCSSDPVTRVAAAVALAAGETKDDNARKIILSALERGDENTRLCALRGLCLIGDKACFALNELIAIVNSGHDTSVRLAVKSLGELGPKAQAGLKSLKRLKVHPNRTIRKYVIQAIKLIESGDRPKNDQQDKSGLKRDQSQLTL
jgi:HEAT repeat protein